ncbi:MAG: glycosyltransferase family 39 protein [Elusimicrobia bacterium]|nr:glycosyltransferase family 39 protein [Elusimicrobiota bacterium]
MKNNLSRILFFSLIAALVLGNILWISLSSDFPLDSNSALKYANTYAWIHAIKNFTGVRQLVRHNAVEPAVPAVSAILNITLGFGYKQMMYFNILLVLAACLGIWLLTERLSGKTAASIAVLLFMLYPSVYGFSRKFSFEIFILPVSAFFVYYLVKSSRFSDTRASAAAGALFGIGMLVKTSFLIYISGPLLFVLAGGLFTRSAAERPRICRNIGLFLLIALAVCGYRYLRSGIVNDTLSSVFSRPENDPAGNLKGFVMNEVSLLFFLAFCAAAIGMFSGRRPGRGGRMLVFLWFSIPFLFLFFMPHTKCVRHSLPMMIPVAVLTAAFLSDRKALTWGLLALGTVQFFRISFIRRTVGADNNWDTDTLTVTNPVTGSSNFYLKSAEAIEAALPESARKVFIVPSNRDGAWDHWIWFNYNLMKPSGRPDFLVSDLTYGDLLSFSEKLDGADALAYTGSRDMVSPENRGRLLEEIAGQVMLHVNHHPHIYRYIDTGQDHPDDPGFRESKRFREILAGIDRSLGKFRLYRSIKVSEKYNIYLYIRD